MGMKGTVRNYLSIGGPNMGVSDIPNCFEGPLCDVINGIARDAVYSNIVQNHLGPADYFRDEANMEAYLQTAFLPYLNNETGAEEDKESRKARFESLNALMLV